MRFWGKRGRFLYAAPGEIERQIQLARERISAHLRLLHGVLDGNDLTAFVRNKTGSPMGGEEVGPPLGSLFFVSPEETLTAAL